MENEKELSHVLETYLENILELERLNKKIRVTDLADRCKVTKSGVNRALKSLKSLELVEQEYYKDIVLTQKGRSVALSLEERHYILEKFFVEILGVEKETANKDACIIEHMISSETIEKLEMFVKKLKDE